MERVLLFPTFETPVVRKPSGTRCLSKVCSLDVIGFKSDFMSINHGRDTTSEMDSIIFLGLYE